MPRVVSFIVLLAFIMLVGAMFFQVMVQFIVPLFLAAVMVVVFKPLHFWMLEKCGGRRRVAAALTSLAIVLLVLLPITLMLIPAVSEGASIYNTVVHGESSRAFEPALQDDEEKTEDEKSIDSFIEGVVQTVNPVLQRLQFPTPTSEEVREYIVAQVQKFAAQLALGGVKVLASTLIGLAIMVLTMYYFFADGPVMVGAMKRMSPLDDAYEQELLDKFGDVSRAVVVATLASAIVQGLLAGAGYWVAGIGHVFFLTAFTGFMAMVPFVGCAAVWVPACLWLYFHDGRTLAAALLAAYCVGVVSMVDNIIKPFVLHGQSKLHPLLALLSVIGGIQALGPIGILVGPMLVAFLQALIDMLNKELRLLGKEADTHGTPVVFATKPADETSDDDSNKESSNATPQSNPEGTADKQDQD